MHNHELKETARTLVSKYASRELQEGFKPEGLHPYQDAAGNLIYIRIRLKHPDGKKWIRPFHFDTEKQSWLMGEPDFPGKKPLYFLPQLTQQPEAIVWIVEGELKTEKLSKLGFLVTTSGSSSSANDTDWEILRDRQIIIWRDFDDSGLQYAHEVTKILTNLNCSLQYVDVEKLNLSKGDDVVDWLKNNPNATQKDVLALPLLNNLKYTESKNTASASVELVRASDVVPEPISWLWNGWLAAGKMHIFGGAPGTGKTTISMALAAIISCGGRWPDGSRATQGNVLVWSGEDDYKDTLVPRLKQAGADLSRVYFISAIRVGDEQRCFDPALDLEHLQQKLAEIGNVRLLIIDPIVSAILGDSHKNAEVRRGLQPLADLAITMGCALLGITHFSKGTAGRDPVERLTGSLAFGALARIVFVAVKQQKENENDQTVRLFLRAKSNIGKDNGGFEYELEQAELNSHPGIVTSYVLWGQSVSGSAQNLLASAEANSKESMLSLAKSFLSDLLSKGPLFVEEIEDAVKGNGYSPATIKRAKQSLGIESYKETGSLEGKWFWKLPNKFNPDLSKKRFKDAEETQQNNMNPFEQNDPLQENDDFIEIEL
jgi:5S rRNA maturation endonuclease (ribonuclease M5)